MSFISQCTFKQFIFYFMKDLNNSLYKYTLKSGNIDVGMTYLMKGVMNSIDINYFSSSIVIDKRINGIVNVKIRDTL